jgi:hypothetical protein
MSEGLPTEKGKEEALPSGKEGNSGSPGRDQMKDQSSTLDKYLTGKRGAGLADVMASARETTEGSEARESGPVKPWKDLLPMYEVGELITFYDRYEGKWKWWRAWVETVILPTELQYRDGMVNVLYQICPHLDEDSGRGDRKRASHQKKIPPQKYSREEKGYP